MAKRSFDVAVSFAGLVLLSPLMVLIALWIKLDSHGSVFFRQERVGLRGRLFRIHKFRTMQVDAGTHGGLQVTSGTDPRITRAGRLLRRYKLDEFPQLIDVLLGDMSLVGPRPEVQKYIAYYPAEARGKVLSVRPGITDWASIQFKDESALLALSADIERSYIEEILPAKIEVYVKYVENRTFYGDLKIILATISGIMKKSSTRT